MTMIEVETVWNPRDDVGVDPATEGGQEITVPAPGPVSIYVQIEDEDVEELLCVGWNSSGSPVVLGMNGGLRLLESAEKIRDCTW